MAKDTGKEPVAIKTALEYRGSLANIRWNLDRIETLRTIAKRAAEKAGSPIPPDEADPASPAETTGEESQNQQVQAVGTDLECKQSGEEQVDEIQVSNSKEKSETELCT